jgi:GNAT superfamily N-acetyltransferase
MEDGRLEGIVLKQRASDLPQRLTRRLEQGQGSVVARAGGLAVRSAAISAMVGAALEVRLGRPGDVDAALSVYLRSNSVRRNGRPISADRIKQVIEALRSPVSWFLIAEDGQEPVGMALAMPAREDAGAGPIIPGSCYLDLVFVVPERWGEGIGGVILDTVLIEARRRGYARIQLWTHEDNQRAQHLYRSRGFGPTHITHFDDTGALVREWVHNQTHSNRSKPDGADAEG